MIEHGFKGPSGTQLALVMFAEYFPLHLASGTKLTVESCADLANVQQV